MDDIIAMGVGQGIGDISDYPHDFVHRQQGGGFAMGREILSAEMFHGQVSKIVLFTGIENGNDTGVIKSACRLGLAKETFFDRWQLGLVNSGVGKGLDGHLAIDFWVAAEVNGPHGTLAQFTDNFISSKGGTNSAFFQDDGSIFTLPTEGNLATILT